jgi:hypothetical protein
VAWEAAYCLPLELPNRTLDVDDYNMEGDTDMTFMDEQVLKVQVVFYSTMD